MEHAHALTDQGHCKSELLAKSMMDTVTYSLESMVQRHLGSSGR